MRPSVVGTSITHRDRWRWFAAAFVYVWVLYFVTNQQTVIPAHLLPLTTVDILAPFLPWTGWIYATVFFMPLFACLAVKTDEDVRLLVVSFVGMTTVDTLIFAAYPTIYPRPAMAAGSLVALPMTLVRFFDTAKNCFPSQHVSAAFLTAFHIHRLSPRWGRASLLLAAAIAGSTLTTKQHYLWDVMAGVVMASAAYRLTLLTAPRA